MATPTVTVPLTTDAARELAKAAQELASTPSEVAQAAIEQWLREKKGRSLKFEAARKDVERRLGMGRGS